ncbi:MAG: inositol monophosphatase [Proteobacteria bacterium]|nr:inositol monophosphatase [Pseudomonadota bacterium]
MSAASWLELVAPIIREAGTMARRRFYSGKVHASRKDNNEWVTDVDREVEEFITERLQYYFPDHGVLGEEGGQQGGTDFCWVIDPLDGTTNFVHRFAHCAVSLAYCERGRSKIAVICDVMTDTLYTAINGGGAYKEDQRLRVSPEVDFRNAMFIASGQVADGDLWPLMVDLSGRTDGMRKTGSSVLDLAWLAAGDVDAVVSGPINYWDVAAGSLLVREAGGFISDVNDNTEFKFGERTPCFVAAAPKVFTRFFSETKKFCKK